MPSYIISGVVTESGSPVERTVRAYNRSTGALAGSAISYSPTGEFAVIVPSNDEHYVVALDDAGSGADFNALIYDRVEPASYVDPHFANVVALLHFNGADGTNSFTDVTGRTWSAVNQAQHDTAQAKWGTASLLLDGNSDAISTADAAALEPGAGAFTLECWVRFAVLPTSGNYEVFFAKWAANQICFDFYLYNNAGTMLLEFAASTNGTSFNIIVNRNWTPVINTWYFVQFIRDGATSKFAVDGAQVGADVSVTGTLFNGNAPLRVGSDSPSPTDCINGWIDDVRYTVGVARAIARPLAPFPDA